MDVSGNRRQVDARDGEIEADLAVVHDDPRLARTVEVARPGMAVGRDLAPAEQCRDEDPADLGPGRGGVPVLTHALRWWMAACSTQWWGPALTGNVQPNVPGCSIWSNMAM